MEKDIEEIREKIETFMEKYNVELEIDASDIGKEWNGKVKEAHVHIKIIT